MCHTSSLVYLDVGPRDADDRVDVAAELAARRQWGARTTDNRPTRVRGDLRARHQHQTAFIRRQRTTARRPTNQKKEPRHGSQSPFFGESSPFTGHPFRETTTTTTTKQNIRATRYASVVFGLPEAHSSHSQSRARRTCFCLPRYPSVRVARRILTTISTRAHEGDGSSRSRAHTHTHTHTHTHLAQRPQPVQPAVDHDAAARARARAAPASSGSGGQHRARAPRAVPRAAPSSPERKARNAVVPSMRSGSERRSFV